MKHRFVDGAMVFAAVVLAIIACGTHHLGLGWFIFFLISGAIAQAIARGKNRNQSAWFALDGMQAKSCKRCNAVQNVPAGVPSYTCWRCQEAHLIGGAERLPEMPRPYEPPQV